MSIIDQDTFRGVGVILAGGLATRMQGKNKALQHYNGKALYRYSFDFIQEIDLPLKINANRDASAFLGEKVSIFPDDRRFASCGPLSGIVSGLNFCKGEYTHVLFSPCDTPLVPSDVFTLLIEASKNQPEQTFYIETSSGAQPLHVVMPVTVLAQLKVFLKSEQYKVMAFYRAIEAKPIYWNDETRFTNINFLNELL